MNRLVPLGILLSAFLLTMASVHAAGQVDQDYPEVGTPFKVIGTDDIYLTGADRNLHWVADLRALDEARQEFDILWDKLRVVPLSVIVDKYTIGTPFLARKILRIQRLYSDTPQYFLPRWDGEGFVLYEVFSSRLTPRYGIVYLNNAHWYFKHDLYLRERDWVERYGSHEGLRKVPHPCRSQIEEHGYCRGWYGLAPNHWLTGSYYSRFSPKTIHGPGSFIAEYYGIHLWQARGKNNFFWSDGVDIAVVCHATTNSVKYYAYIEWPTVGGQGLFIPPDPDELTFRFGGDIIHSSDLGVSWYIYDWSGQLWPAPSQEDTEALRGIRYFRGPGLVTSSGVETFMDKLEQGVPDFAVQADDGPSPRPSGGRRELYLSEWDTSGAAMAIASLKERCERLPKPTSAYPRPTLTPLPRLTPTALAEPTATPQPTAATGNVVGVTPTFTPSPSSTTRTYVPGPAVAPPGKTTHWERYDRWVEGGFAIRVRSEDRTASLAFRCEPGQGTASWVAIVETSFAIDSASVVEYSVPDTGSLYPRADDDVSWHVRNTGLGLYVTGEPAEQFFRQVEADASDPREDLPVYLSVDGVSTEFDLDWLQSALPSHDFGRPGCPVSRLL